MLLVKLNNQLPIDLFQAIPYNYLKKYMNLKKRKRNKESRVNINIINLYVGALTASVQRSLHSRTDAVRASV